MKNYILLTAVAGGVLGSYCAMASNSATMTVTATIAHDVSLRVTRNISWNMTIDPSQTRGDVDCSEEVDGCEIENNDGVISGSMTAGRFTANIPNLANHKTVLSFEENGDHRIIINSDEYGDKFVAGIWMHHVSGYEFAVAGTIVYYGGIVPAPKVYDFGSVTIQYTPES
ncbi:MAG: hypothetical protein IJ689_04295 [Alphaproteobacteria bacterium]|nr:hypothetical protein [Alphaproteobacteria bacterium]